MKGGHSIEEKRYWWEKNEKNTQDKGKHEESTTQYHL